MKRGALKGLGSSLGVNASRTSDTDSDDEGANEAEKKRNPPPKRSNGLRAAPGWEDFTEGKTTPESSLVGLRGRGGRGRGTKYQAGGSLDVQKMVGQDGHGIFIGPVISTWVQGRI